MYLVGLDFETRSKTDIKAGAYKYASCPTTGILCLSVVTSGGAEWVWYPSGTAPSPAMLEAIKKADLVIAHNTEFDRNIWEFIGAPDYGLPSIPAEKWYCSSAQCRVNGLPAALEKAAKALGIKIRKDTRGRALIKLLSLPDPKTGKFRNDPKALGEMGEYCLQDSRLMMQVVGLTRMMSQQEHLDWQITCEINERGAKVDTFLAERAVEYADAEREAIAEELTELTGGVVTKHTQSIRAKQWLLDQCNNDLDVTRLMTVYKDGEAKLSFDKGIRGNLLEKGAEGLIAVPDNVLSVIELFDQGNKSSVSKFQRMLDMANEDDRVRGAFVFAGAAQTQRFASRGLQLHNMRRDCWSADQTEELLDTMEAGDDIPDVMNTLSKLLRPAIVPEPGNVFVVGDWSAIEGRVLPWLTMDPASEAVLDVFRADEDIYMHTAAAMRIDDRQIGKVATLALGYQGAVNAFKSMAKNYGLTMSDAQIDLIVRKWRKANQWAVRFWRDCERAAVKAMRRPGEYIPAGRCQFVMVQGLMNQTLCGVLPDGTLIQYPDAKLEYVETPHGGKHQVTYAKASLTPKADATEWPRHTLYGGLIAENFTQGTAGCILKHSLRELRDDNKAPVVLHVHDEIVQETQGFYSPAVAERLQKVMETPPAWAEGLPLKAEPAIMARYGK